MKETMVTTISELPDEILNHILSFLPLEIGYRMSCLSKRWKNILNTHTVSSIDLTNMFQYILPKPKLLRFIEKYLLMRQTNKINIQSFRIKVNSFDPSFVIYMNTWVKRLVHCNVKEISFSCSTFEVYNLPSSYCFPQAGLSAKSLKKLKLQGISLKCQDFADIKLISLKELILKYVAISVESIELLIKSCVAMKHLCLCNCFGFTSIKIAGLHGLNKLTLLDNYSLKMVEIDEPSLVGMHLRYHEILMHDNDVNFVNCTGLKKLILSNVDITDEWLSKQLLVINHLEDLELNCPKIISLDIASINLKRLSLVHRDELSKVNINAPNLQSHSLRSNYKLNTKLLLLSLNAPLPLKVELDIHFKVISRRRYIDLLNFISAFNSSRLTLRTNLPESSIPLEWMEYFSDTKTVSRFQKFWVDPETRFLDVLRSICPDLKPHSPTEHRAILLKGGTRPWVHAFIGCFATLIFGLLYYRD